VKVRDEVLPVSAKEKKPKGLDFPAELDSALDLVETFIHVVHMQGIVGLVG